MGIYCLFKNSLKYYGIQRWDSKIQRRCPLCRTIVKLTLTLNSLLNKISWFDIFLSDSFHCSIFLCTKMAFLFPVGLKSWAMKLGCETSIELCDGRCGCTRPTLFACWPTSSTSAQYSMIPYSSVRPSFNIFYLRYAVHCRNNCWSGPTQGIRWKGSSGEDTRTVERTQ